MLALPVIMDAVMGAVVAEAHLVAQPQGQAETVALLAVEQAEAVVLILEQGEHQAQAEMEQLESIVGR